MDGLQRLQLDNSTVINEEVDAISVLDHKLAVTDWNDDFLADREVSQAQFMGQARAIGTFQPAGTKLGMYLIAAVRIAVPISFSVIPASLAKPQRPLR